MAKTPHLRLPKHQWISDVVKGKTFADIGGLWGAVNETVTIASLSGASEVTMVDVQAAGSKWWVAFDERCAEYGVDNCKKVVSDVLDDSQRKNLGKFDVVHCSGIVYHVADPISFIINISLLAREYFVIGSMLIPERIENEEGLLITPPGTFRCVPLLGESEKRIIAAHYDKLKVKIGGVNNPAPSFLHPVTKKVRTGPWWHLFTAETMIDICKLCGVEIVETHITAQGAQNILCRICPA